MDTTQLEAPQSEVAEAVVDQVIAPQNSVDRELAEALEALKAEEAKQAEPEIQAQAAQPGKEVQSEYKKPEHDKDPTAAIISLRKKLQETATQNLLLQGQVQALSSLHRGQTEGEQPEQVEVAPGKTAETLQSVRELKLALAEQFDQGDISAREMEQRRQELDDKEWQIREAATTSSDTSSRSPIGAGHGKTRSRLPYIGNPVRRRHGSTCGNRNTPSRTRREYFTGCSRHARTENAHRQAGTADVWSNQPNRIQDTGAT